MANEELEPEPMWIRVIAAVLVTGALSYFAFLILDIVNGWGQGWVVLGYYGLGVLGLVLLVAFISVWTWVYRGSGRYQMKNRR